jgi:serine protease AprX
MKNKKLIFLILGIFLFSFDFVISESDELKKIISEDPEKIITVVISLKTQNEGLLDELKESTKSIDEKINHIADLNKKRFSGLKQELGYDEEVLELYREKDEEFMEKFRSLEEKYRFTVKDRKNANERLDKLITKRNKIIIDKLEKRYEEDQREFIYSLKQFDDVEILYQDLITNKVVVRTLAKHFLNFDFEKIDDAIYDDFKDIDESDVSVPAIGANIWHNNNYYGYPWDLLFINSNGILVNHTNLDHIDWLSNNYANPGSSATDPNDGHDTVIAGIIASDDATYFGVSPNMDDFYNAVTNSFSTAQQAVSWALNGVGDDADAITMSKAWGGGTPPYYGMMLQEEYVDEIVDYFDVNWVKSAGNNGGSSNENVTLPAGAYNIIAVGASNDFNTVSRSDDRIAAYSSKGPVYVYGNSETRIKPDIVAPGSSIINTDEKGGFSSWSGTSFSAPHVASSIMLIRDYSGLFSATQIRALLFNTAEDRDESSGVSGTDGPDNTWGYGYLDMDRALFEIDNSDEIGLIGEGDYVLLQTSPNSENDKVTMVWNRHIINNDGVTNNLDLFIYDEDTNSLIDSSEYEGRNIEQVVYDGSYNSGIVKVKLEESKTGNGENFGISTNQLMNDLTYPIFDISITVSEPHYTGMPLNVTATINNTGELVAHNVNVTLDLTQSSDLVIVNGDNPQSIGSIDAGDFKTVSWEVMASNGGYKTIGINVDSLSYGELFEGNNTSMFKIRKINEIPGSDLHSVGGYRNLTIVM